MTSPLIKKRIFDMEPKHSTSNQLGDILLDKGIISEAQLHKALEKQKETGDYLGEILIHMGHAEPGDVYSVLSRQRGIPYIDITNLDIDSEVLRMIPRDFAEKFTVLPLFVEGGSLKVAVADHLDVYAFDGISTMTGLHPEPMLSSRQSIRKAIRENYARPDQLENDMRQLVEAEKQKERPPEEAINIHKKEPDTPAVRFVNLIIQQGIERNASDLHLEPHKDSLSMRYRIDGILHEATPPTSDMYSAIIARIKVLANLDVAEYRLPQDGRLRQDPDVLMVGEIRDRETGEIAIRASMTGHLVLSTIHTLNTVATIGRLKSMGIQPYMLASSISLIIAQRLVRRICPRCREQYTPLDENIEALGLSPGATYYHGKGCKYCNETGYRGRIAVYEILPVTKKLSWLISRNADTDQIEESDACKDRKTLRQSGAEIVKQGISTAEEILARTPSDE